MNEQPSPEGTAPEGGGSESPGGTRGFGTDGQPGADDQPGTDGQSGADGQSGTDGQSGADGQSGTEERSGTERPGAERGLPAAPPNVRDPWKGLRGVMAGTLVLEFIVFALALPVVWRFGGGVSSAGFAVVAVLSVLMLVAGFVQRRAWGLPVALVLQLAMVACFVVHPAVGIMGLIFAGIWGYMLYLRHDVAKRMRQGRLYDQLGHPPGYPPES